MHKIHSIFHRVNCLKTLGILLSSFFILFVNCKGDNSGLYQIKEYGKWGFINANGKVLIECQFEEVGSFSENYAPVRINGKWGFIDTNGRLVILPQYENVSIFSNDLCHVKIRKGAFFEEAFINKNGSIAFISSYERVGPFNYERAVASLSGKTYVIDKKGEVVFEPEYSNSDGYFYDGILKTWDGSTKYYDTSGNVIVSLQGMGHGHFSENLANVQIGDSSYYIGVDGIIKIDNIDPKLTLFDFNDGMAQITIAGYDHKSGFMDKLGRIVIPIRYHAIHDFSSKLAAFKYNSLFGFINQNGDTVIKPQFQQIANNGFIKDLCEVKKDGQWGYINKSGEFVWNAQDDIEYSKLDNRKWALDTLENENPASSGKYIDLDKKLKIRSFDSLNDITLKLDTSDITVFSDKYVAYKLYLINASKDTVLLSAQDGEIMITQQAKNENGNWQDIEYVANSYCGNSYHKIAFAPSQYYIFPVPIYKGKFETQLRFKFDHHKGVSLSDVYRGKINKQQFVPKSTRNK